MTTETLIVAEARTRRDVNSAPHLIRNSAIPTIMRPGAVSALENSRATRRRTGSPDDDEDVSEQPRVRPDPALGLTGHLRHRIAPGPRVPAAAIARRGGHRAGPGVLRRCAGLDVQPGRVQDGWHLEGTYPPAGMHGGAPQPVYQVDDQGVPIQLLQP